MIIAKTRVWTGTRAGLYAAVIALAAAAGGCGVRGSLENPGKGSATASADSGQGKKETEAPKPHKDFVLDGLIR
ncbi:MAG: hypothetical protein AB7L90_18100 [Hyphomicrobiaceae bacterium]